MNGSSWRTSPPSYPAIQGSPRTNATGPSALIICQNSLRGWYGWEWNAARARHSRSSLECHRPQQSGLSAVSVPDGHFFVTEEVIVADRSNKCVLQGLSEELLIISIHSIGKDRHGKRDNTENRTYT